MISELFKREYISYEGAAKDSLGFRCGSIKFIEELDEVMKWCDGLAKACKAYSEDFTSKLSYICRVDC